MLCSSEEADLPSLPLVPQLLVPAHQKPDSQQRRVDIQVAAGPNH